MTSNRQTDRQTDKPNYRNPRCACTPGLISRIFYNAGVYTVYTNVYCDPDSTHNASYASLAVYIS